jgi:hypothetical protein
VAFSSFSVHVYFKVVRQDTFEVCVGQSNDSDPDIGPQILGSSPLQQAKKRISTGRQQSSTITAENNNNNNNNKEIKRSPWEVVRMHALFPSSLMLARSGRQQKVKLRQHRRRHPKRGTASLTTGRVGTLPNQTQSADANDDWLNRDSSPVPTLVLRCKVYIENEWPSADSFLNRLFYLQVEDDVIYGHTLFSTSTNSVELVMLNAISVLLHYVLDVSTWDGKEKHSK